MRFLGLFIFTFLFANFPARSQQQIKEMEEVLDCTNGFDLERKFAIDSKKNITPFIKTLYEMKLGMLFNEDEKALSLIDTLVLDYHTDLGSWQTCRLINKKAKMLVENGFYAKAADYIKDHLKFVNFINDSLSLMDREKHYNEMRDVPCPEISRPPKSSTITYELKVYPKGCHFTVPVSINGKTYMFIHDICCGHTSISEDMAKEMGLKIVNDDVVYGGSGGTSCKNATIDSLLVGDIVFRHPLLNITPVIDSSYAYCGILGNDFMRRVGAIDIYTDKRKMVFPYNKKSTRKQHNMMQGNGLYFLQAHSGSEEILFTLDTGANSSIILSPYYNKHKDWFDRNGKRDTLTVKEAGKKDLHDYLTVKSMPVRLGKAKADIKNVLVFPNLHFDAFGEQQGIFGTSFVNCFRKISVDFKDMRVDVKH